MNFKVLSHAGLLVEHHGVQLIVDPWILGSCYWRSWWNFPEPNRETIENLRPQYIYLTHLHWDHFHGPSLKKFDPNIFVIVPKVHSRRMVEDLNWFTSVRLIIEQNQLVSVGGDYCCGLRRLQGA